MQPSVVWPDKIVFEQSNLAHHIKVLRRMLGDDPKTYIETVPKRGYRFVAAVTESWQPDLARAEGSGTQRENATEAAEQSVIGLSRLQLDDAAQEVPRPTEPEQTGAPAVSRLRSRWPLLALVTAGVTALLAIVTSPSRIASPSITDPGVGRFLARSTSEGKQPLTVPLDQTPGHLVITPD